MITLTREEAQQVLDALEAHADIGIRADKAIKTLRARLAQPEREWQGLTDEELRDIFDSCQIGDRGYVAAMVEAKLKEKNSD
jgi:hypothetical protein